MDDLKGKTLVGLRAAKILISAGLIAAVTLWVVFGTEQNISATDIASITFKTMALCAAALLASNIFAIVRLKLVAATLGYRVPWVESAASLSVGALGGAVFFQIAGQLIARNVIMGRLRIPPGAVVLITGMERAVALLVSVSMALIGAIVIYGHAFSIDYASGGNSLVRLVVGFAFVVAIVSLVCWQKTVADLVRRCTFKVALGAIVAVVLTVAIQLATMAAYLALTLPIIPAENVPQLVSAIAVIMFLASVPISFSGWGVRELSAVAAFGEIGMASHSAFIVAAIVGVLSLVTMLVIAAISSPLLAAKESGPALEGKPSQFATVDAALGPIAAVLVLFSVYIPVNSGLVNVTLADPIALIGGALFALHYISRRRLPGWGAWNLNGILVAATVAILLSYFLGVMQIGFTTWATTKATGWFVLLAYFGTGAMSARLTNPQRTAQVLWPYAIAAIAIVGFDFGIESFRWVSQAAYEVMRTATFYGFSNNRNAFCFALTLALGISVAINRKGSTLVAGIAAAGIILTGSRAGLIAAAVSLGVYLLLDLAAWRKIAVAVLFSAVAIVLPHIALPDILPMAFTSYQTKGIYLNDLISPTGGVALVGVSPKEHLQSIIDGLGMFLEHPLFGGGLGSFYASSIVKGEQMVIHSTPVWIMAEMGVIGAAAFAAAFGTIGVFFYQHRHSPAGRIGIFTLSTIAVFGLAHEILYQRPTWLILGVIMGALPARREPAVAGY